MSKARSDQNADDFRHPLQIKPCELCGGMFARLKDRSDEQWEAQRFCGQKCGAHTVARFTEPSERFDDNYIPEPNSGCWLWIGYMMGDGYGQIKINGELIRAHRLSYRLHKGPIDDVLILHTCDNRLCVNPDHLYIGTHQQNMDDKKNRGRHIFGERHHHAKLTDDDVRAIRKSIGIHSDIAKRFGISRPVVSKIIRRELWGHVDG